MSLSAQVSSLALGRCLRLTGTVIQGGQGRRLRQALLKLHLGCQLLLQRLKACHVVLIHVR